jgi:aspartate aminotransferase
MSGTLPDLPDHIAMGVFDAFQIPYSALEREHEQVVSDAAAAGAGTAVSTAIGALQRTTSPFEGFLSDSEWTRRAHEAGIADFVVGNPHDPPMPEYVDALARAAIPARRGWYAYTMNERRAVETVAASLRQRFAIPFESGDVFMTNGNFAGLAIALRTVVDPGDEVIFVSPPWFFYEALIEAAGATPVRVAAARPSFDLDLEAIERAITQRTRAIIVNSPNNPTGRIYPPEQLGALGDVLETASSAGQPIYLLSDEAYNRIVFSGERFRTPAEFYPATLIAYSYGKTLLAPGQRIGYVAMPPSMPDREDLRSALLVAQTALGWTFPNAVMQYAIRDLEQASIDVPAMQRRRDRIVDELTRMGYEVVKPEGTFYVMVRSPLNDDVAFVERLAESKVFVLPGRMFELPGWFRISLTANDGMVERSLAGFERALADHRVTHRK